jgi:sugar/nucleoside kinase (ribokinase family)
MTPPTLDILGIGNAIVDVLAPTDEAFVADRGLPKGGMRLIDTTEAEALYAAMPAGSRARAARRATPARWPPALGAKVGFLGKVAADQLGEVFAHDIKAVGVHFPTPPLSGGAPTARCLILVTPDGQRTMNTFLGACVTFGEKDVDAAEVARAKVVYLEGYLFDPPEAQAAFKAAARAAHAAGRKVAITLSDAFCVGRHREAFRAFVKEEADILFANESEILALYETDDFEAAAAQAAARGRDRGPDAQRARLDHPVRRRAAPGRRAAHQGRGHDRRRRRLCGRLPGRLGQGAVLARGRALGQHRRGRGHQPLRRPAAGGPEGARGMIRILVLAAVLAPTLAYAHRGDRFETTSQLAQADSIRELQRLQSNPDQPPGVAAQRRDAAEVDAASLDDAAGQLRAR